jgi:hypothetical protein
MENGKPLDAMAQIVEILTPLQSEDRIRVVHAAMVLLGETKSSVPLVEATVPRSEDIDGALTGLPPRARTWMKQHGISDAELQTVFQVTDESVEVIAAIPGKNRKEQANNAYILTGIAQLISTGNPAFLDKSARALCESSACYDSGNHAVYIKGRGKEFTGTKEKGWALTVWGLKRGAELIKELNKQTS